MDVIKYAETVFAALQDHPFWTGVIAIGIVLAWKSPELLKCLLEHSRLKALNSVEVSHKQAILRVTLDKALAKARRSSGTGR